MADDKDKGLGNQIKETAKDAGKQKGKKAAKRILSALMPILIGILIFLVISSAVYSIFSAIVDFFTGWFKVLSYKSGDSGIEIDEEKLDELIAAIEATGIDLEDLELLRRNKL